MSSELIKRIKEGRHDLSRFLIHFTRRQNGLVAIEVLTNIIQQGFLKSGHSIRNGKPTVFGKEPAVCFTDMPFSSFLRYVNNRKDDTSVSHYGLALLTEDMFKFGARNVIYGTTNDTREVKDPEDPKYWTLQNINFPPEEFYRYMLTTIGGDTNDWMHEREWRWANHSQKSMLSGLPIWKRNPLSTLSGKEESFNYKCIVIIVKYNREIEHIKSLFVELIKDPGNYDLENIRRTVIISREDTYRFQVTHNLKVFGFDELFDGKVIVKVI